MTNYARDLLNDIGFNYVYKVSHTYTNDKMLGTLWTIILIIVAIIVIVILVQFLIGILAIAPIGIEYMGTEPANVIALPVSPTFN